MSECYAGGDHHSGEAEGEAEGEPEGEPEGESEGEPEDGGEDHEHHAEHKYCFTKLDEDGFGVEDSRVVCQECGQY